MEETDVCYPIPSAGALQQLIPEQCPAKALTQEQRQAIAVQALGGYRKIASLADEFDVSRKFVYEQAATAQAALDEAFTSSADDDQVLFELPVTKSWLRQAALSLTLLCHSPYRGIHEFFRDVLDVNISVGTVHNIVRDAIDKARLLNQRDKLNNIDIAGLDEIFQKGRPVLVGADIASTYCFLLSLEEHRDADTWGIRLLEMQERGFAPRATIADFAGGIRAGQRLALGDDVSCRGDVFHALNEIVPVVTYLENRAYEAMAELERLQMQKTKLARQGRRSDVGQRIVLSKKIPEKALAQDQAIKLTDDVALLTDWLHYDILAVSGLSYADRCALYDFVLAELQARQPQCQHLKSVCTLLKNHRDQLLAFAAQLDQDLAKLAADFEVPLASVRQMLDLVVGDERRPAHWQKEAALRQQLRQRFCPLHQAVSDLAERIVRASSVIENLNSRLRNYFFLRRQVGSDYLVLLQFYLNHRRFLRSEHAERVDKSPAELLTGQRHPHWLEMLGYTRFSRN
jgi:hypothetical protein